MKNYLYIKYLDDFIDKMFYRMGLTAGEMEGIWGKQKVMKLKEKKRKNLFIYFYFYDHTANTRRKRIEKK